ncbi:MAG: hypothetical protein HOP11_05140 [Saprospiraceae bacterium]|nr:hypothetical protein [Saprospiraceae bacterium]
MYRLLYILIFKFVLISADAQFNFQVGYQYLWSEALRLNDLIAEHNLSHPEYSQKLSSLNGLHGIHLGLRYQINSVALTGSWSNDINKISSLASGTSEIKNEYFFKKQFFSLGLESARGLFALGTTIDLQILNIKNRISGSDDKINQLTQNRYGSTFYSQLDFPLSERMGLLVRLFYSLPWEDFNLQDWNKQLNPQSSATNTNEKFHHIGISLIFSNGFQTRF